MRVLRVGIAPMQHNFPFGNRSFINDHHPAGFEKYTTPYGVYIHIIMNNGFAVQLCIVLQQIAMVCGNEYKSKNGIDSY